MRKVALVLVWIVVAAGGAQAANPSLSAGGGGMTVLPSGRDVVWSEPPNLDGRIATSEVIGIYGLESEIANDFYFNTDLTVQVSRWWGAYFGNYGCSDIGYATNWNLRFYDDGGCMPNNVIAEYLGAFANESFVYCQGGFYPIFRYEASVSINCSQNTLYWFRAQASDHVYPPQCGRLAAESVVGCDTVFRSAYFSYPDWTAAIDVVGEAFDASQEFEAYNIPPPDRTGACCIGDQGDCRQVYYSDCASVGGEWQGTGTDCDPNPCIADPVRDSSWGQIKHLYR